MDEEIYDWLCDTGYTIRWKPKKVCSKPREDAKDVQPMKLYQFNQEGQTLYGQKLAVNSQGQWVMEVKGTGYVIAVDQSIVEEVLPHTIGIQFDSKKTVYHYFAEAGKYNVGDFYILDAPNGRSIVQVVSVDSKSDSATIEFKPMAKIKTE